MNELLFRIRRLIGHAMVDHQDQPDMVGYIHDHLDELLWECLPALLMRELSGVWTPGLLWTEDEIEGCIKQIYQGIILNDSEAIIDATMNTDYWRTATRIFNTIRECYWEAMGETWYELIYTD